MKLARSTLKIFLARVVGSASNFIAIVIFSRELGASVLGNYYPFLALIGILSIPSDLGIRSAAEKRISEGENKPSFLTTAILLKIPPLLFVSVICWIVRDYINIFIGESLSLLLIFTLITSEMARFSITILRGEMRAGETAIVEAVRPICWLLVGVTFHTEYGVYALIYGYLLGSILMNLIGWAKVSISISLPSIKYVRSLFEYGRFSVVSTLGGYFYSWMDIMVLTFFVSAGIVGTRTWIGAYENAWRLTFIVMLLSRSIATTIFPQFSRWDTQNATDEIEEIIPIAIMPPMLIVIPAFVGISVLSDDILRILFGSEFTVAWLALIILSGEKILQSVHVVLGRSLQAIDRPDLAAYATVISLIINLILNIALIWKFGIVGAAIATAVSFAVNTFLHARYLNQFLTIQFPTRELTWSAVCSLVMGLAVLIISFQFYIRGIWQLIGIVLFGILIYGCLLVLYQPIRSPTVRLFRSVLRNQDQ